MQSSVNQEPEKMARLAKANNLARRFNGDDEDLIENYKESEPSERNKEAKQKSSRAAA